MSVGVTAIYVDLCILSILAVRLPKLAVEVHLELIRSRGRRGVLNLLFLGVRGCPWVSVGVTEIYINFCILSILAVRLLKLAVGLIWSLLDQVGGGKYLISYFWESAGVTAIYVDLRILSILAVRLPKLAVGAHLELIRSRGRQGVLNLLFFGVRGCPWVSRRFTSIYVFCRYWL